MEMEGDTTTVALVEMSSEPPNVSLEAKDFPEGAIALALNEYYLWVVCAVGLVLNAAAVLTIVRLRPFTTSAMYVILLAVFDSLTLLAKLLFLKLTYYDVNVGDAGCKILSFIGSFLDQFSAWLLVLLTIERFVAVWLPLKVSRWFTMHRARAAVVVTAICLASVNFHLVFLVHQVIRPRPFGIDCGFYPEYEYFAENVWYWVESCLAAIFPCVTLTSLNFLIVHRLKKSREKQKQMISASDDALNVSHKSYLTVMLVTVSVAFVALVLPLAVFNCLRSSWQPTKPQEKARYLLTRELSHLLADCNHGCNFLFYFLSSKRFRVMFYRLVRCRCDRSPRSVHSKNSRLQYNLVNRTEVNGYYSPSTEKRDYL